MLKNGTISSSTSSSSYKDRASNLVPSSTSSLSNKESGIKSFINEEQKKSILKTSSSKEDLYEDPKKDKQKTSQYKEDFEESKKARLLISNKEEEIPNIKTKNLSIKQNSIEDDNEAELDKNLVIPILNQSNSKSYRSDVPGFEIFSKKMWLQVCKKKNRSSISYSELKMSIRYGIPKSLRPRIWFWLADIKKLQSRYEKGIYLRLAEYINPKWEYDLKKDVNRTMVDSPFFQGENSIGQRQLFRIMNAFCNIDHSGVGYAQGSNMIVGTLLLTLHDPYFLLNTKNSFGTLQVTPDMIEEWVFWVFLHIMHDKNQFTVYQQSMVKRHQLLDSLKQKIQDHSPEILVKLEEEEIEFGSLFDQEFFSIMSYKSPLSFSQFAMDMFLLDGHTALIDMISQTILLSKDEIMEARDMEELMYFFKNKKNEFIWHRYHKKTNFLIPFECLQTQIQGENEEDEEII